MTEAVAGTRARAVASPWPVLNAPTHWRRIDFISDLHLKSDAVATFKAWQRFMQTTHADAVFILGDLFEVWVGDDVIDSAANTAASGTFQAQCVQVLHSSAKRLQLFLIHGNRDFLLGQGFARACGLTLLDDPCLLDFAGQRWLLSHGDALCLADTDYMQFRAQVRSAAWQQDFLSQPLARRQTIARALRQQSEARKRGAAVYANLDGPATCQWLNTAQAGTLIHGHTHRPAVHALAPGLRRIVLSDWDVDAMPPRAEVLRLSAAGTGLAEACRVERLTIAQAAA